MTDEELIARLRSNIFGTGTTMLAADRIEALVKERDAVIAARDALDAALEPVAAPNLKRIGTGIYETQPTPDHAAIREAWEKAYWRMRSYAVHDNDCKLNKPPRFDGPCSCGLTAALEEALALIPKGAADERA